MGPRLQLLGLNRRWGSSETVAFGIMPRLMLAPGRRSRRSLHRRDVAPIKRAIQGPDRRQGFEPTCLTVLPDVSSAMKPRGTFNSLSPGYKHDHLIVDGSRPAGIGSFDCYLTEASVVKHQQYLLSEVEALVERISLFLYELPASP